MKTFFTQTIASILVLGLVVVAGTVSAGNPATPNTSGFPNNNTAFPVNTGTTVSDDQVKLGGLAVEAFIAKGNASFDKTTGVQGIVTGAFTSTVQGVIESLLAFGSTTNPVNLTVLGTAYAKEVNPGDGYAALYSKVVAASGQKQPLCATQAGEIIACPGSVTPPPTYDGDIAINNQITTAGNSIQSITPINPWTNIPSNRFPVAPNRSVFGLHAGYTGDLSVVVVVNVDGRVEIKSDTTVLACKTFNGSMRLNFTNVTIPPTLPVEITMFDGPNCS